MASDRKVHLDDVTSLDCVAELSFDVVFFLCLRHLSMKDVQLFEGLSTHDGLRLVNIAPVGWHLRREGRDWLRKWVRYESFLSSCKLTVALSALIFGGLSAVSVACSKD